MAINADTKGKLDELNAALAFFILARHPILKIGNIKKAALNSNFNVGFPRKKCVTATHWA